MKQVVLALVEQALAGLRDTGKLDVPALPDIPIERSRSPEHGDFACAGAMALARLVGQPPRAIAEDIVDRLPDDDRVREVRIAGPGFINFYLRDSAYHAEVCSVLEAGRGYGRSTLGQGERVQVEFVSANPTGPLHVGHGRGAAYGAVVANLLAAVGYDVQREYYLNDAGRQMDTLAVSVWLRYLEMTGETVPFPSRGYRGDYVRGIARALRAEQDDRLRRSAAELKRNLPPDAAEGGDGEVFLGAMIDRVHSLLGESDYQIVFAAGRDTLQRDIREDLERFGVTFDCWYSEAALRDRGAVNQTLDALRDRGYVYENEGAIWFRSSAFGDEKDRVLVRENGEPTYFAADVAYHLDKFERGFERVIDVWGADHHGHLTRMKGAMQALGRDPEHFEVLIVQLASLIRGGEKKQMSTRAGEYVTLAELRNEVGKDAARFFYVMRKCEQHLDFDLDLAKSQTNENPVYYVQYAHARICSVLRQAEEQGVAFVPGSAVDLSPLTDPHERSLMRTLSRYPEVIESAARDREPHQVAFYLREIANEFHTYYNAQRIIVEESATRQARMALSVAIRHVLANGLELLGVGAPESM